VPSEPNVQLLFFLGKKSFPHHAAAEQSHMENTNKIAGTIYILLLRIIALQFVRPEDKDEPLYYRDYHKEPIQEP
jgi:hypothetical protein